MADTVRAMEHSVRDIVGETDVESLSAGEVLDAALQRLPAVALACSFQKEESVLIDMFPESYTLWRELEQRYGIRLEIYEGPSLGRQAAIHGEALWERNPDLCCSIRKIGPLGAALSGLDGWITGVRRDQSPTRSATPKLGWDERHEIWKASPLADWTDDDVWAYVQERGLPVNELHERGYASIGCTHCTAPGTGREGRWSGGDKTECGLHA